MQDDYDGGNNRMGFHQFYCSPDIIIMMKFRDIKEGEM
jgi:hypothetical protein